MLRSLHRMDAQGDATRRADAVTTARRATIAYSQRGAPRTTRCRIKTAAARPRESQTRNPPPDLLPGRGGIFFGATMAKETDDWTPPKMKLSHLVAKAEHFTGECRRMQEDWYMGQKGWAARRQQKLRCDAHDIFTMLTRDIEAENKAP